jgi:nucleoside phosphorylase
MQYTLGNIGNHKIVIGCLPVGDKGIGAAATVATRMKDKFPNLQFGLLVGIGGGVPTKVDVRLGDVVVSQPVETSSSVVQYDMGQSTPDGFIRTGFLNAPPPILRQALANLQARHMCDDIKIPKYLAAIEEKIKFKRPPPESVILFESTYDHANPGESCDSCDKSKIKPRKPRIINDIVVHYGTIASGSRVIKNARERDLLSNEPGGVLCFEMEAAGLMNNFPCLVIRGISDYADSHKNDEWQPYAAAVAAAFAKDLLVDIPAIALPRIAAISVRTK